MNKQLTSVRLNVVRLTYAVCSVLMLICVAPVRADEAVSAETLANAITQGSPMTNFRWRYEYVNQEGYQSSTPGAERLDTGEAVTLRSLIGWKTAPFHGVSLAAQLIDVHAFNDAYNDKRDNVSEPGKHAYPYIVDPGYTDINQLFLDWTGVAHTSLRLGRQQVNLDNVRFVGDIGFRQNMQVFDGLSVVNKSIDDIEIFAAHFSKVRQITTKLRDGNIDILNLKYKLSATESLTGYGYLIDMENLGQNGGNVFALSSVAQGGNGLGGSSDSPASAANNQPALTDASSKTFGVRLNGAHRLNPHWQALYTAEYARQSDYRGGNGYIDAHYMKLGGGAAYDAWSIRVDQERLSSNDGKYAFQTPLGTNHLFQGWADVFLTTPRQGIKDTFVTLAGNLAQAKLYVEYHVFTADEKFQSLGKLGDKYGNELDLSVSYPFNKALLAKVEYAKFRESDVYGSTLWNASRKGDKEIIWLTGIYTF